MTRDRRPTEPVPEGSTGYPKFDRPWPMRVWYDMVRFTALTVFTCTRGLRAGGRNHIPASGPALLISNHASHLDSFVLGIPLERPLNFVARSTLFLPLLGAFIRSVGGFPIQREGMGASGLKETLKRLRRGGIVILFPEGTRTYDGEIAPLKSGIAVMAARAQVPIIPAAIAGTYESWPRSRLLPRAHPIRIEYGPPIFPESLAGLTPEHAIALITERLAECHRRARSGLARDLGGDRLDP